MIKSWYEQDVLYFKKCTESILPTIHADTVLIDGCEFAGYSEFKKLNSSISLIFLDDCFTAFKNNQVFETLVQDREYTLLTYSKERNGYALFHKNDTP